LNISTVTLRVVGEAEKGTHCLGVYWATLFAGDINTGTCPSRLAQSRINMVISPVGLGPENDSAGDGHQRLETTHWSSHQRGRPTSTNPQLSADRNI
jgi:hypothetical protein